MFISESVQNMLIYWNLIYRRVDKWIYVVNRQQCFFGKDGISSLIVPSSNLQTAKKYTGQHYINCTQRLPLPIHHALSHSSICPLLYFIFFFFYQEVLYYYAWHFYYLALWQLFYLGWSTTLKNDIHVWVWTIWE